MSQGWLVSVLCALLTACAPPAPAPAPPPPPPVAAPASAEPTPAPRLWTAGTVAIPVLMYHDVVTEPEVWFDQTVAEFTAQMNQLAAAGVQPISLDDVVAHLRDGAPLPDRPIALTFDQGTLGLYQRVYPLLKERGWPATYFVHTGYVGRPSPSKEHVTWGQLREMAASGLIDVQPMSVTFPEFLGQLDDAQLRAEIEDSVAAVEREMGRPAKYFAYPYGNGDERVAAALDRAGIVAAWNEVRAPNASPADRLFLPRFAPKRLAEAMSGWDSPPAAAE